jgi:chorismate mutase
MKDNVVLKKELEGYRKDIDKIDTKIITLLNERGKLVLNIGKIKKKLNMDISQLERERQVIERMTIKSKILKNVSVESIWKEIIKACKLIQTKEV